VTPEVMKKRTKAFALEIVRLCSELPDTRVNRHIGGQLLRCGTSVGANYRASCRAKSRADFISKMGTVEEESDESAYWMEVLVEAKIVAMQEVAHLIKEANEILAIAVSSIKTARE